MGKFVLLLVMLACAAWAANLKLYMTDGTYHIVREYKVVSDRVHFYSVERSDWEEVPAALVDVKRTQSEAKERQEKLDKDAKILSAEEQAERDLEKEKMRIPQNPGAYWIDGAEVKVIKPAESVLHTNKGRRMVEDARAGAGGERKGDAGNPGGAFAERDSPIRSRNSTSSSPSQSVSAWSKLHPRGESGSWRT